MRRCKIKYMPDRSPLKRYSKKIINHRIKSRFILLLFLFGVICTALGSQIGDIDRTNNEYLDETSFLINDRTSEFPLSSAVQSLNHSIKFNQTAFLPGSHINITYTLHNNYSQNLNSIQQTLNISELTLISGDLNNNLPTLGIGDSIRQSVVCELSETGQSLDVVFLIDGSGSMGEELAAVKLEIQDLIANLTLQVSQLRIGFLMFGCSIYGENPYDDSRNMLDFTENSSQIGNFIDTFNAAGSWEPWGDALNYIKSMSWQSSARLAILITDEPCNPGYYIGDSPDDTTYYFGEELYQVAQELSDMHIVISTMQCYGGGPQLAEQLQMVSSQTEGKYTLLSAYSSELINEAILMCEEVLSETGQIISLKTNVIFNGSAINDEKTKWIIVDNNPPSISPALLPVSIPVGMEYEIRYKFICTIYDAVGVENLTLFYKFNTTGFLQVDMNKNIFGIFSYLMPSIAEGTTLDYYFSADDRLGNSAVSHTYSFIITKESDKIEIGNSYWLQVENQEFVIYKMNSSNYSDSLMTIGCNGIANISLVDENNTENVYSQILNSTHPFINLDLTMYPGNYHLIIKGLRSEQSTYVSIAINKIYSNISISPAISTRKLDIQSIVNQPIFLRVNIELGNYSSFHCLIKSYSEFTFYHILIYFNQSIISSRTFLSTNAPIECSGVYFIRIIQQDHRVNPENIEITVALGEIDDTPYWISDGSSGVGIPGFFNWTLSMAVFIGITLFIVLRKKGLQNNALFNGAKKR